VSPEQVALRIKTVPADADPYALQIARHLVTWFDAAGIDATVTPMAEEELFRQVLLNQEFDVFVAPTPDRFDVPDALYPLLHSRYAAAPGWQNPFGYTDLEADELLERQRRTDGDVRREAVAELQRTLVRTQPFTVVGFPDDIRAVRTDRYGNWRSGDLQSPLGYLRLNRRSASDEGGDGAFGGEADGLRVATTDKRATENLNPLAVEFRRTSPLVGLLYDSIGYSYDDGSIGPWLAPSWTFSERGGRPVASLRLREGLRWHDGEPLTASDIAFTFAFLADTSLGGESNDDGSGTETATETAAAGPIPAPRFQGRSSLVDDVIVHGDRAAEIRFVDCNPAVAARAFTVPILPAHVWENRTGAASVGGIEFGAATEALVTNNIPPVGSGPLAFVRNTPKESLVFERFDDHFLSRGDVDGVPPELVGTPEFDRLTMRVVGSDVTAVESVASGWADVTGTGVGADTVPRIARTNAIELLVDRSRRFYLVGYNARRPPLTNPRFRHALARLVDKEYLLEEVLEGYGRPAASPLDGTRWLPADLEWDESDPVTPFLGERGELDADRAREMFRSIGYRYDDGRLIEG
jgi:peptide/nickel transport system substrate-binding protein